MPAEYLAEDQRSTLTRRQVLEGRYERKTDALASGRELSRVGLCRQHPRVCYRRDPGSLVKHRLERRFDRRARWGDPVPDGYARLSLGIEDTDDVVADIAQALRQ